MRLFAGCLLFCLFRLSRCFLAPLSVLCFVYRRPPELFSFFFCHSGFSDTSKLFGASMNAEVSIVYCQWKRFFVCMCVGECT